MSLNEMLVLWVALQALVSRHDVHLLRPTREHGGKDPIEDHKIILQLVDRGATEPTAPVRHHPFVFRRPVIPGPEIQEGGFEMNFSTYFNLRKPGRRGKG